MYAKKWASAVALVAMIVGFGAGPGAAPAQAAAQPLPMPSSPKGLKAPVALPSALDPVPAYQPQTSCYPVDKPGTVKLRNLVLATYKVGGRGNISRGCTEGTSEHAEGRAWDWMINPKDAKQKAAAANFLSWVTKDGGKNARRLGIMYVIHNKLIWGAYRAKDGWRPSSGHLDHIHVSLTWNGARGNTSFWTGKVAATDLGPCRRLAGNYAQLTDSPRTGSCPATVAELYSSSRPDRVYGMTGQNVKDAQGLLGASRTSKFDAATWTKVRAFQKANDLVQTGVLDTSTWRALDPARVTKSPTGATYSQAKASTYGFTKYGTGTLRQGDLSGRVVMLQGALGLKSVQRNGYFGDTTKVAVLAMQKKLKLTADGTIDTADWKAMHRAFG